jgi:hypothetical protein
MTISGGILGLLIGTFWYGQITTSGFTLLRNSLSFAMELLNVIIALSTIVVLESLQAT